MNSDSTRTRIHCPKCDNLTTCEAFQPRGNAASRVRRKFYPDEPDLHFFSRHRRCLSCKNEFETYEVNAVHIAQLRKLRQHVRLQQSLVQQLKDELKKAASACNSASAKLKVLADDPLSGTLAEIIRKVKIERAQKPSLK